MRMIDCFYEVLFKVINYVETFNKGENESYEEVRGQIERALTEGAASFHEGGYSEEQYELACFAVVAFIDEAFLLSNWIHKEKWRKEMLQMKRYNTFNAGEGFYEKLNNLSPFHPAEKDVREVYYYCLSLGFRGKYYRKEDQSYLDKLKSENLTLLKGVEEHSVLTSEEKQLFPEAYISGKEGSGVKVHIDYRPFFYGIPVIALLITYYLFKFDLYEISNYLVTTI